MKLYRQTETNPKQITIQIPNCTDNHMDNLMDNLTDNRTDNHTDNRTDNHTAFLDEK